MNRKGAKYAKEENSNERFGFLPPGVPPRQVKNQMSFDQREGLNVVVCYTLNVER
jgi:hypothetical protein